MHNLLKYKTREIIIIIYSKQERRWKNVNKQGLQEIRLEYANTTGRKRDAV